MGDKDCQSNLQGRKLERGRVLESLIFLTENRDEMIKAHGYTNGITQRDYMSHKNIFSSTGSKAIMLTVVIDAKESRNIRTWNIPTLFIQTELNPTRDRRRPTMKIKEALVDSMKVVSSLLYKRMDDEPHKPSNRQQLDVLGEDSQ